ncbi:universal stress protein [Natronorubrum sp. JWXQ-INN-674]|uniref:Universal stress protein n=2 Tax=Natronorubrum halalkaliphilum TaxID=2691917 RepID=A0A6B0VR07_9EURY|nr:universal stress protein [Natronorubrum halalkaliphilum]
MRFRIERSGMFDTILVPTDDSAGADATIGHAIELGETYGSAVHALYVVEAGSAPTELPDDERTTVRDRSEARGREATIRVTDRAEERGLDAAREVREGVPYREVLSYTANHDVDLVVMGTHGRTGADRVRLGSTTERVLTRADVPVLSVRLPEDGEPTPAAAVSYDRIVVPTDGSDHAERAAETALDVAETYDAEVCAVYVVDSTTYDLEDAPRSIVGLLKEGGRNATEAIAEMAHDRGLDVRTDVRRGPPAEELLEYASTIDASLVAMGTRGQTVGSGPLLGSTTARIVRRSTVPVLTVS